VGILIAGGKNFSVAHLLAIDPHSNILFSFSLDVDIVTVSILPISDLSH
jgi:hypothetical protein